MIFPGGRVTALFFLCLPQSPGQGKELLSPARAASHMLRNSPIRPSVALRRMHSPCRGCLAKPLPVLQKHQQMWMAGVTEEKVDIHVLAPCSDSASLTELDTHTMLYLNILLCLYIFKKRHLFIRNSTTIRMSQKITLQTFK